MQGRLLQRLLEGWGPTSAHKLFKTLPWSGVPVNAGIPPDGGRNACPAIDYKLAAAGFPLHGIDNALGHRVEILDVYQTILSLFNSFGRFRVFVGKLQLIVSKPVLEGY